MDAQGRRLPSLLLVPGDRHSGSRATGADCCQEGPDCRHQEAVPRPIQFRFARLTTRGPCRRRRPRTAPGAGRACVPRARISLTGEREIRLLDGHSRARYGRGRHRLAGELRADGRGVTRAGTRPVLLATSGVGTLFGERAWLCGAPRCAAHAGTPSTRTASVRAVRSRWALTPGSRTSAGPPPCWETPAPRPGAAARSLRECHTGRRARGSAPRTGGWWPRPPGDTPRTPPGPSPRAPRSHRPPCDPTPQRLSRGASDRLPRSGREDSTV
jgi:hypothetical protein